MEIRDAVLKLVAAALVALPAASGADTTAPFRAGDTVAWLGGARVVAAQRSGVIEALVAGARPVWRLRWRSLAWEGDTVFERPRELNYPGLPDQLRASGATVALLHFGEMESLAGPAGIAAFVAAYESLLGDVGAVVARILITPPVPPDGTREAGDVRRSPALDAYIAAIQDLGRRLGIPVVPPGPGLDETAWSMAVASEVSGTDAGNGVELSGGRFAQSDWEALRRAVVARNRLWFDYSRPMNWAFLAGDRTDQPSSRDHRDRSVRWFPEEMEQFVPLIAAADREIWRRADAVGR